MRRSTPVNIHDAKNNLSRLLDQVANGGEIVITKAGKPVAKLVPLKRDVPRRKPGFMPVESSNHIAMPGEPGWERFAAELVKFLAD